MLSKILIILIINSALSYKRDFQLVNQECSTVSALHDATFEFFIKNELFYDVITCGKISPNIRRLIDKLIARRNESYIINVIHHEKIEKIIEIKSPTLFFVESPKDLAKCFNSTNLMNLPQLNILTYIRNPNDFEKIVIPVIPTFDVGHISQYSYFLFDSMKKVELKTFEWWTEAFCYKEQLITINTFNKSSKSWQKSLHIPPKFHNFHNCTLKSWSIIFRMPVIDILNQGGLSFIHPRIPDALGRRERREIEVVNAFAQFANMSLTRTLNKHEDGVQLKQHTSNWQVQYSTGGRPLSCSTSFVYTEICAIHSPAEPYTNYEKMLLPFDYETWLYLIILFCCTFVIIFIINFMPLVIQDTVYGKGIRTPAVNALAAIFGIGQSKVAENSFGRILFVTFLIFCLIIRTGYQGVFFEIFTSDLTRRPPDTFADLKERNYTLYGASTNEYKYTEFVKDLIPAHQRPNVETTTMFGVYHAFNKMPDPKSKLAIPLSYVDVKLMRVAFDENPRVMKEHLIAPPEGICVYRNNFAANLNLKVMNALITAGIPQYWLKYSVEVELRSPSDPPPGPKVFSVEDLKFGFMIWLAAISVSIAAFLIEIFFYLILRIFGLASKNILGVYCMVRVFMLNNFSL